MPGAAGYGADFNGARDATFPTGLEVIQRDRSVGHTVSGEGLGPAPSIPGKTGLTQCQSHTAPGLLCPPPGGYLRGLARETGRTETEATPFISWMGAPRDGGSSASSSGPFLCMQIPGWGGRQRFAKTQGCSGGLHSLQILFQLVRGGVQAPLFSEAPRGLGTARARTTALGGRVDS